MKTRNSGEWTEARFNAFIKSVLRAATNKWGPKNKVKKAAWIKRGVYLCAGYRRKPHEVRLTLPPRAAGKKRINNVQVDHIVPVIDPETGFTTWDDVIERLFCEEDGLQVLCHACHQRKTKNETNKKNKRNRS